MVTHNNNEGLYIEQGVHPPHFDKTLDDDGRPKRTGTALTASAHIITAVIGSGVLSLAWAIAQLGWAVGPAVLVAFSLITYMTSTMLADGYRSPDPVTGKRNYTYMEVVRANLGGRKVQLCGLAQYVNLVGVSIGYTITASISMVAVKRSNCFHKNGHHVKCNTSNNPYMIIFGCIQILLSQIPNFHELSWLSIVAAIMSFAYSTIGLALSIAKVVGDGIGRTSLTGVTVGVDVTASDKVWRCFQALGDIAFAYAYSNVLVEIQDTLKSSPPENKVMKKASLVGVSTTSLFYILCGCVGYAAFGNKAPGNFLTGFGFYEPFWLVDFANVCIAVHLVGAYQVFTQPVFGFVESWARKHWPENKFITREHPIVIPFGSGIYYLNWFRLVWRTAYVIVTAILAMLFPFFNDFLGLLGSLSFWPLTVFFPIELHISQAKVPKFSTKWIALKTLSYSCLVVSLIAAAGSIQGLVGSVKKYKPFQAQN
ncbi:amino acid permease 6-like isoform X2 [Amaranthus tricolor]|uniref:amino acid permease 6-like isoform X2 n=1 Tax=Amaranthus tricolor TaxID=29722 RepID=UPI00258AE848|nr:amino acid permease 6-like isoform X2 [Amaranthus tricolor]